jgi:hypothetical protein
MMEAVECLLVQWSHLSFQAEVELCSQPRAHERRDQLAEPAVLWESDDFALGATSELPEFLACDHGGQFVGPTGDVARRLNARIAGGTPRWRLPSGPTGFVDCSGAAHAARHALPSIYRPLRLCRRALGCKSAVGPM